MPSYTPAQSDDRLFLAQMDSNGILTPVYQLSEEEAMTLVGYTPAQSDDRLFAAALSAEGFLVPLISVDGLADIFANSYVYMGAITFASTPAITLTQLVNSFNGVTFTPAYSGSVGVWTITANVADTFKTTSLILCNMTYPEGTVMAGYVRTSDTVVTISTRGVPGSLTNINRGNVPFIVVTPRS